MMSPTAEAITIPCELRGSEIERHLETRWMGRPLHCFDSVGSTNTLARELARKGATSGTAVVADRQEQGRGRRGRSWVSPPHKNLYLSVILRVPSLEASVAAREPVPWGASRDLPQLSLLAGVAACDTLGEWHPTTIKWPNDILIDGRKVGGILTEMEGRGGACPIIGIGLNLNAELGDFPPDLREKAGSLALARGEPVDRPRVAARLLAHLERRCEELARTGFAPIAAAWRQRSDMIGRFVRVEEPGGIVQGTVTDLDADGALRIRTESGGEQRVVAGDVSVIGGYRSDGKGAGGAQDARNVGARRSG